MSDKCGSCDCADKSQCTKNGYTIDVVETQKSYTETIVMDVSATEGTKNGGKCNCGASCSCTNCTCGH